MFLQSMVTYNGLAFIGNRLAFYMGTQHLWPAIAVDFIFVEAANLQIELARLAVPHSHTQSPFYTQSTEHDQIRGVQE